MNITKFTGKREVIEKVQEASQRLAKILEKTSMTLTQDGFPLETDTYHFFQKVVFVPENRVERVLFSLLLQAAYQSEIISGGSASLGVRFASKFIEELLKFQDSFENVNQLVLEKRYDEVTERFKEELLSSHKHFREERLESYIKKNFNIDKKESLLGEVILEALKISGLEGKISIEDSKQENYLVEQKSGYYFTTVKPYKFMLPDSGYWEAKEVKAIFIDGIIDRVAELDNILAGAMETKFPTLIVAGGFSEEVIATIKVNNDYKNFNIMPLKMNSDIESLNSINDIATAAGTDIVSVLKGDMVSLKSYADLPFVERVRVSLKELNIEQNSSRVAVSQQLKMLLEKRQAKNVVEDIETIIDKRIKSLISSAVTIQLPNMTIVEKERFQVKIDTTLRMIKSLINYGEVEFKLEKNTRKDFIEKAFYNSLEEVFKEGEIFPFLSLYTGVYLCGKVILSIFSSSGLVEREL